MNTLLLIDSLGSGGAQRQIIYHALALKKLNHNPVIIYYHNKNIYKEQLIMYNLKHEYIPKDRYNYFTFIFFLREYIKKNNIQLITSYLFKPNIIGLIIKMLNRKKIKLIISERTFELNTSLANKLFRIFYLFSDFITCNSYHQLKVLKSKLPFLSSKIIYLPNVIDIEKFKNINSTQQFLSNIKKIIAIGRIEKNKNPLILIRAIGLMKKNRNIQFNIKWFGSIIDTKYYKLCCDEIEKYGLIDNWLWMGECNNIQEQLQESAIVFHGSFGEGFPNVICEALSTQRIVIASNVYDHPIIIRNKLNGFLFNPNNLSELIDILDNILLLSNTEIFEIQKQCELSINNNFSLSNHINILAKLYIEKA